MNWLRRRLGVQATVVGVLLIIATVASAFAAQPTLTVHFIDVGQGDAILIQCHICESNVLIDSGDRFSAPRAALVGYLATLEVTTLDAVIATHPHADHIGGFVYEVFPRARAGTWLIGAIYDSGRNHTSTLYEDFRALLELLAVPVTYPKRGDTIEVGQMVFEVLHPPKGYDVDKYKEVNDASIVLRLVWGEVAFLFAGDIEELAEREILASGRDVRATVLKVAHHGSDSSTSEAWLSAVRPSAAVIMVGEGNSHGHPHAEILTRLEALSIMIFRTDLRGDIVMTTDGKAIQVQTQRR